MEEPINPILEVSGGLQVEEPISPILEVSGGLPIREKAQTSLRASVSSVNTKLDAEGSDTNMCSLRILADENDNVFDAVSPEPAAPVKFISFFSETIWSFLAYN